MARESHKEKEKEQEKEKEREKEKEVDPQDSSRETDRISISSTPGTKRKRDGAGEYEKITFLP